MGDYGSGDIEYPIIQTYSLHEEGLSQPFENPTPTTTFGNAYPARASTVNDDFSM
jgi:hypothetical protein